MSLAEASLKLHGYWRSSCSYRVRLALHYKELSFDNVPVNLLDGAHKLDDYLAKNPAGLVPALEVISEQSHDILVQSAAICEWLETSYAQKQLLPENAIDAANVRAFINTIACEAQPLCNLQTLKYLEDIEVSKQKRDDWYHDWMIKSLVVLEALCQQKPHLKRYQKDALASEIATFDASGVTLAEIFLLPHLYNARRFNIDLTPYPLLRAIEKSVSSFSFACAAHPDQQVDAIR